MYQGNVSSKLMSWVAPEPVSHSNWFSQKKPYWRQRLQSIAKQKHAPRLRQKKIKMICLMNLYIPFVIGFISILFLISSSIFHMLNTLTQQINLIYAFMPITMKRKYPKVEMRSKGKYSFQYLEKTSILFVFLRYP